jgi:chorismate-pyruvate lyase
MTREIGLALGTLPTVTPTHQGPSRLAPWEASLLGVPRRYSYAREITLSVSGVPVMLARTLSTYGDPAVDVLRKLNQRPLAEVLFQDHRWRRITPPIPLLERAGQRPGRASLWQYRSRNHSGNRGRILVQEYFLEDLLKRPDQTT